MVRAIAVLCATTPAFAQQGTTLERVEITGSSIKRVQTEGATPVQTITRTEIERAGIVNAEQLLMRISANGTGADNLSSNVGIQLGTTDRNNNGNSSANLRGLGSSSTLVLLNGRRIAAHGAKGNSVDLNWIPMAAVERVEVLKDGASATYGTDAIGGVINFILRKDYAGFEAGGFVDVTEEGGGNIYRGSLLGGWGNLERDRFNVMASLAFDKQEKLGGTERSFSNGFQPARGLSPDTAGTPFATQTGVAGTAIGATYTLPTTGSQTYNRANLLSFQGNCDSIPGMSQYQSALWGAPGARFACAYDYGGSAVLIQPLERTNFVGRGAFAINPDTTAFVETVVGRSVATKQFEPYQITTNLATAYPVNGPYYQNLSAYIPSFDATKPIAYRWRCTDCGGRTIETTTDAYRVLAGLEGTLMKKWDYKIGLSTAESKAQSVLGEGYLFTAAMNAALASGVVNPWVPLGQSQPAAGMAALRGASAAGTRLFDGKSKTTELDGVISGELAQLPAGALSAAVGFDWRKESYAFSDGSTTTNPVFLAPFDPEFPKVSRDIKAVFAEVAVPVVKGLEATLAVRHDDYSDFGTTTNPKVSLKYMPVKQVLVRGSYNTGFRAPSFFQLYTAQALSQIPGNIADPELCPRGNVAGADLSVCAIRPNGLIGGNPALKPEESKQWTVGLVLSPTDWFTAAIDLWEIKRTNLIYQITPQQIIANYAQFGPSYIQRGTDGRIDGPGGFIRAGFVNADGDITRGTDLSLQATGKLAGATITGTFDGTYIDSHRTRIFSSQPYVETAGQWNSRDLFVRWKHQLGVTYTRGPWSSTVSQSYTSGYKDEKPVGTVPAGWNPKVDSYTVYNVSATYTGIKNLTITAGIKNLFDTDPPFTAHNLDFAAGAGWDPRVADPRGRAYTLRLNYVFF
ncbi:TonB-dependent receptor [Piscinibacter sakaiensis]|uniref:TonB-dependent receptor n=1 Tax=Piscinibacter sakaiensis TaxID=1547922 RepID=A0A0K8P8H7_PISS1|nr:TonB-dependent receptor [Piscinibacter sakaiensis]